MNEIGRGEVAIHEIVIGERIRMEVGDIDILSLSISLHGLLNPIIVHQLEEHRFELVDGYRRILAFKALHRKTIPYRLFSTLEEDVKVQLELELCLRRKSLTYIEEAKACKQILMARRRGEILGRIGRFAGRVKNKDIAMELGMSESTFSINLKLADALEEHPELENVTSRREAMQIVNKGEYTSLSHEASTRLADSFLIDSADNFIKGVPDKAVDFVIVHPDRFSAELLTTLTPKIKLGGACILFCQMENISEWKAAADALHLNVCGTPYIWNVKGEDSYIPFLWMGKSRELPLRAMPMHMTYAKSKLALSFKAKPYNLISLLVKCNTEQGQFVLLPDCEDIESIRCCVDLARNVRACTLDKILHDRLLMSANIK